MREEVAKLGPDLIKRPNRLESVQAYSECLMMKKAKGYPESSILAYYGAPGTALQEVSRALLGPVESPMGVDRVASVSELKGKSLSVVEDQMVLALHPQLEASLS